MLKFKDFSRPLGVFQVLFRANLIFKDFSRQHVYSSTFQACVNPALRNRWRIRNSLLDYIKGSTTDDFYTSSLILTLNEPITTKDVCFSHLKCLRSLYGKQCGPRSDCCYGAVCSGSTLFASILNLSLMLGNYLQQTTSADDIFRCIFSWCFKGQEKMWALISV